MYSFETFEDIVHKIQTHDQWYHNEVKKLERERDNRNKQNHQDLHNENQNISVYLRDKNINLYERWDAFVNLSNNYEEYYPYGYGDLGEIEALRKNPLFNELFHNVINVNEINRGDDVKFVDICDFDGYIAENISPTINTIQNREYIMEEVLQFEGMGIHFDW